MWKIDETNVRDLTFEEMTPDEVLYDFDGPRIFTFAIRSEMYFACWSDEDSQLQTTRYLVVGTSAIEIERLKAGALSLDRVLDKKFIWIVDRNFANQVIDVTSLMGGIASIPDGFKPEKGTLLWDHLEPEIQNRPTDIALELSRYSYFAGIGQRAREVVERTEEASTQQRLTALNDSFYQEIKRQLSRFATANSLVSDDHPPLTSLSAHLARASSSNPRHRPKQAELYSAMLSQNASRIHH